MFCCESVVSQNIVWVFFFFYIICELQLQLSLCTMAIDNFELTENRDEWVLNKLWKSRTIWRLLYSLAPWPHLSVSIWRLSKVYNRGHYTTISDMGLICWLYLYVCASYNIILYLKNSVRYQIINRYDCKTFKCKL